MRAAVVLNGPRVNLLPSMGIIAVTIVLVGLDLVITVLCVVEVWTPVIIGDGPD